MHCFSKVNEHLVIIVLNYFSSNLQTSILICSIYKDLFQTAHGKTRILDMHSSFLSFQGEVRRWGFTPDHLVLVRGEGLWQVYTCTQYFSAAFVLSNSQLDTLYFQLLDLDKTETSLQGSPFPQNWKVGHTIQLFSFFLEVDFNKQIDLCLLFHGSSREGIRFTPASLLSLVLISSWAS